MSKVLNDLKHSLQALALPASEQARLLKEQGGPVAGMVVEFIRSKQAACSQNGKKMTNQQEAVLDVLSKLLVDMSSTTDASIWSAAALKNHEKWEAVRELAVSALSAFGWDRR